MFNPTSCEICGYSITDPVCYSCYIRQTRELLNDLKVDIIINDFITNKLKYKISEETI